MTYTGGLVGQGTRQIITTNIQKKESFINGSIFQFNRRALSVMALNPLRVGQFVEARQIEQRRFSGCEPRYLSGTW